MAAERVKVLTGLLCSTKEAGSALLGGRKERKRRRGKRRGGKGSLSLQKGAELGFEVNLSYCPLCLLKPLPTCQFHFSCFRAASSWEEGKWMPFATVDYGWVFQV